MWDPGGRSGRWRRAGDDRGQGDRLVVPRGDSQRLAAAFSEVFDRPEEAARRTTLGRQMVLERFAEENVFTDFERVMRRVASSRTPRRRPEPGN